MSRNLERAQEISNAYDRANLQLSRREEYIQTRNPIQDERDCIESPTEFIWGTSEHNTKNNRIQFNFI